MWGLYKGFGVNPSVTLQKESKLEYTTIFLTNNCFSCKEISARFSLSP